MSSRPSITKELSHTPESSSSSHPFSSQSYTLSHKAVDVPQARHSIAAAMAALQQSPNPRRPTSLTLQSQNFNQSTTTQTDKSRRSSIVRQSPLLPPPLSPRTSPRKQTIQQTFESYLLPPTPPPSHSRDRTEDEEEQFIVGSELESTAKPIFVERHKIPGEKRPLQAPNLHDEPTNALSQACTLLDIALRRNQKRLDKSENSKETQQNSLSSASLLHTKTVEKGENKLRDISNLLPQGKEVGPSPTPALIAINELLILTERSLDRHYTCPSRFKKETQVPHQPPASTPKVHPHPKPTGSGPSTGTTSTIVYVHPPSTAMCDDNDNYDVPRLRHSHVISRPRHEHNVLKGPGGHRYEAPLATLGSKTNESWAWGAPVEGNSVVMPVNKAVGKSTNENNLNVQSGNSTTLNTDSTKTANVVSSAVPPSNDALASGQSMTIVVHNHHTDVTLPHDTPANDDTFYAEMLALLVSQKKQHDEEFKELSEAVRTLTEKRNTANNEEVNIQ